MPEMIRPADSWPEGRRVERTEVLSRTLPWVMIRWESRVDLGTSLERRRVVSLEGVRATDGTY